MDQPKLVDEVANCLADYIAAFNSKSGARIAQCYVAPCLILRADGSLLALSSSAEIAKFFQARVEQLHSEGCRDWRYTNLEVGAIDRRCVRAAMDWEPLRADGTALAQWRQTYQLLKTESGLRFMVSTVHAP